MNKGGGASFGFGLFAMKLSNESFCYVRIDKLANLTVV